MAAAAVLLSAMTYQESAQIRKLCFKHKIRFYVSKDQDANYSVQLYGHHASENWNLDDFAMAKITVKFIAKAQAPFVNFHLN